MPPFETDFFDKERQNMTSHEGNNKESAAGFMVVKRARNKLTSNASLDLTDDFDDDGDWCNFDQFDDFEAGMQQGRQKDSDSEDHSSIPVGSEADIGPNLTDEEDYTDGPKSDLDFDAEALDMMKELLNWDISRDTINALSVTKRPVPLVAAAIKIGADGADFQAPLLGLMDEESDDESAAEATNRRSSAAASVSTDGSYYTGSDDGGERKSRKSKSKKSKDKKKKSKKSSKSRSRSSDEYETYQSLEDDGEDFDQQEDEKGGIFDQ